MKIKNVLNLLCGYQGDDVTEGFHKLYSSFGIPESAIKAYRFADGANTRLPDLEAAISESSSVNNNNIENKTGEFRLVGPIVTAGTAEFLRWLGEDATSAKDLREFLANNEGDITIRINSPGGLVSQAAEMISLLAERMQQKATITAIVDGIAASAAAMVLIGPKKRLVSEFSQVMYHRGRIALLVEGDVNDVRRATNSVIKQMESFDATIVAALMKVTGKDESEVTAIIDNETYFNATEALDNGIATGKAFEIENMEAPSEDNPDEAKAIHNANNDLLRLYELAVIE